MSGEDPARPALEAILERACRDPDLCKCGDSMASHGYGMNEHVYVPNFDPIDEAIQDVCGYALRLEADLKAAAGEVLVPIPAPGTDAAKMLFANRILKAQLEAAQAEIEGYKWAAKQTGFTVQTQAADRHALREALAELVAVKDLKDAEGKTPEYEHRQPLAWKAARAALARARE